MFEISEDLTIECTRGDAALITFDVVSGGESYVFSAGDVVRFSVFAKKDCKKVVLRKDTEAVQGEKTVTIQLTGEDTKIGDPISKPVDYRYEVELNPETFPQTLIGYDKNGPKIFRLYPESVNEEDGK